MTLRTRSLLIAALLLLPLASPARDGTKEEERSLIAAWEAAQKSDPKTEVLEKIGDRSYRYKTSRFPYDGKLSIANVVIQTSGSRYAFGSIEPMLDVPAYQLMAQFPDSYAQWTHANRFYRYGDDAPWQNAAQLQLAEDAKNVTVAQTNKNKDIAGIVLAGGLALAFVTVLALAIRYSVAHSRKQDADTALAQQLYANAIRQRDQARLRFRAPQPRYAPPRFRFATNADADLAGATEPPLKLTQLQKQNLERYMALRDTPNPTLKQLRVPGRPPLGYLALLLLICGALLWWISDKAYPALLVGLVVGAWVSAWYRQEVFRQIWPATHACLDWRKVERLLKSTEVRASQ